MKKFITSLIITVLMFIAVPLTANAFGPFGTICQNGDAGAGESSAVCTDSASKGDTTDPIQIKIAQVTQLVAFAAGVIAVIIMIIGAMRYILSGGDSNKVSSAKGTILYAAIGLVVIVAGQSIIVFVLDRI